MIINIKHKNDLITLDFKTHQIRYLEDFENKGFIHFINYGHDISCYEYLFKEDKKIFFKSLREDLFDLIDKKIIIKNCEVLE